jgi:hypothetical protein
MVFFKFTLNCHIGNDSFTKPIAKNLKPVDLNSPLLLEKTSNKISKGKKGI